MVTVLCEVKVEENQNISDIEKARALLVQLRNNEIRCTRNMNQRMKRFIMVMGPEISYNVSRRLIAENEKMFRDIFTEISKVLKPLQIES